MSSVVIIWRLIGHVSSYTTRHGSKAAVISISTIEEGQLEAEEQVRSVLVSVLDDSIPVGTVVEVTRFVAQIGPLVSLTMTMRATENKVELPGAHLGRTYREREDESGLAVGDWVRVVRSANRNELGWGGEWSPAMNKYVGSVFKIHGRSDGDYGFRFLPGGYDFPFFVLEKVKTRKAVMDDSGEVALWGGQEYCLLTVFTNMTSYKDTAVLQRSGDTPKMIELEHIEILCS